MVDTVVDAILEPRTNTWHEDIAISRTFTDSEDDYIPTTGKVVPKLVVRTFIIEFES